MTPRGGRGERGAAAVEFVIIVPALGLLIGALIGGARIWFAHAALEQIAETSARAASLARTASEARVAAERIATSQARTQGLSCTNLQVSVDLGGFAVPVGRPAQVAVQVRCAVPLADLIVPGWPGQLGMDAEGVSALDRYRGRG